METGTKPWEDDEVDRILEDAFEHHAAVLTAFVDAADLAEIKQACVRAFRLLFYDAPDDNWARPFEEAVQNAANAVAACGPAGPAQILRDYRFLEEFGALIAFVRETARDVVSQKVPLTPEMREKFEETGRRLRELSSRIRSECPHLLETMETPQAPLRLNNPRRTAGLLADALLDGDFVLGKRRIMSLELGQYYRAARGRASAGERA
jgi:hypothetical protein